MNKLPFQDPPDLFGMHQNAEIAYLQSESALIVDNIISIQPKIASHNQELVYRNNFYCLLKEVL